MTIGQSGVGTQLTDGFVTMADAMLVGIGLVNLLMVILVGSLLVPVVLLFALLAVIPAGICFAYCVGGGLYGVALAAVVMLSMAGIMVAAAILTPIGMPTAPILMAILPILPILPIFSISTHAMDSFVNMA